MPRKIEKTKGRPMGAWWLKPSFYQIVYKDNVLLNFIGIHEPRKFTKDMEYYKKDPRMYAPKLNFSIYTSTSWESFGFYAEDASKLVSGMLLLDEMKNDGESTLRDQARFLVRTWESNPEIQANPYYGFNPQIIGFMKLIEKTSMIGYVDVIERREPIWHENDITWLKGCNIIMKRAWQETDTEKTKELIVLGKDNKYNQVVIGVKKDFAYKNKPYTRIVPLRNDGSYFLACLQLAIEHPPRDKTRTYPVISNATFERGIQQGIAAIGSIELKSVPLSSRFGEFTRVMEIEQRAS